jgi:hypothetical protein
MYSASNYENENISLGNDFYDEKSVYLNLYDSFESNGKNFFEYEENSLGSNKDIFDGFDYNEKKENVQQNSIENSSKTTETNTDKEKKEKETKIDNIEKTDYLIQGDIFSIKKEPKIKFEEKETKEKDLLGKKRLDENHTKNAFDNIVRKIKSKLFGAIIIILNKSLEEKNKVEKNDKRGKKGERKNECFLKPEQQIILQTNVKENLELLDMKLREIFSKKVSEKVKNYSKEHQLDYNKNFIEKIKDDPKKQKTNEILDMTFFQCLEHFRGSQKYEALNGLEIEYENVIEDMNDDIEYKDNFIENLRKYEILFRNKKPRKSKKKIVNKDDDYY